MQTIRSDEGELEALLQASELISVSARTTPKIGGVDKLLTAVVFGKEKEALAEKSIKQAKKSDPNFVGPTCVFKALDL